MSDTVDKRVPGEPSLSYRKRIHPAYKANRTAEQAKQAQYLAAKVCPDGRKHSWEKMFTYPWMVLDAAECSCYIWYCTSCGNRKPAKTTCKIHADV